MRLLMLIKCNNVRKFSTDFRIYIRTGFTPEKDFFEMEQTINLSYVFRPLLEKRWILGQSSYVSFQIRILLWCWLKRYCWYIFQSEIYRCFCLLSDAARNAEAKLARAVFCAAIWTPETLLRLDETNSSRNLIYSTFTPTKTSGPRLQIL